MFNCWFSQPTVYHKYQCLWHQIYSCCHLDQMFPCQQIKLFDCLGFIPTVLNWPIIKWCILTCLLTGLTRSYKLGDLLVSCWCTLEMLTFWYEDQTSCEGSATSSLLSFLTWTSVMWVFVIIKSKRWLLTTPWTFGLTVGRRRNVLNTWTFHKVLRDAQ